MPRDFCAFRTHQQFDFPTFTANAEIEIGLWPPPIGIKKPVAAIMRDRNRYDPDRTEPAPIIRQRRHPPIVEKREFVDLRLVEFEQRAESVPDRPADPC